MSQTVKRAVAATAAVYVLAEVVLLFAGGVLWSLGTGETSLGELLPLVLGDPLGWLAWALEPSWVGLLTTGWASTVAVAYLAAAVLVAGAVYTWGRRREPASSGVPA